MKLGSEKEYSAARHFVICWASLFEGRGSDGAACGKVLSDFESGFISKNRIVTVLYWRYKAINHQFVQNPFSVRLLVHIIKQLANTFFHLIRQVR
jgi:hypothetical protein